jgi:hypothetical protein
MSAHAQYSPSPYIRYCGDFNQNSRRVEATQEREFREKKYTKLNLQTIFKLENEILMHFEKSDFSAAQQTMQTALLEWDKQFTELENKKAKLDLMQNFANGLFDANKCSEAQQYYERIAAYAETILGRNQIATIYIQLKLGELYLGQQKIEQANAVMEKVLKLVVSEKTLQTPELLFARIPYGDILSNQKKFALAQQQYEQVLEQFKSWDSSTRTKNEVYKKYAQTLYAQDQFVEGERVFAKVQNTPNDYASIYLSNKPKDYDADIIQLYKSNQVEAAQELAKKKIAELKNKLNEIKEQILAAEKPVDETNKTGLNTSHIHLRSLKIREVNSSFALSKIYLTHAEILHAKQDFFSAQLHYQEALNLSLPLKSSGVKILYLSNSGLALLLTHQKKWSEAKPYMDAALSNVQKVYVDEHHPEKIAFMNLALQFYREINDTEKVNQVLQQFISMETSENLKQQTDRRIDYVIQLAELAYQHLDFPSAKKYYELVLFSLEKSLPKDHARVQLHAQNLYATLTQLNLSKEANELRISYQLKPLTSSQQGSVEISRNGKNKSK